MLLNFSETYSELKATVYNAFFTQGKVSSFLWKLWSSNSDNGIMKLLWVFDQEYRPGIRNVMLLKQNLLRDPKRRTHVFSRLF